MREMQFTAIALMALLTLKLLLLPVKVTNNSVINRSRWLMLSATAVVGVQFLLQYIFRLREYGVTQAVMLNLSLLIPATVLLSFALLCLQRRLEPRDVYIGVSTWLLTLALLTFAVVTDGQPLLSDTPERRLAERVASVCFAFTQFYHAWRHLTNLKAMHDALSNYYDRDMDSVLRWMKLSIFFLPVVGLFIPLIVFFQGPWLAVFSLVILGGVFFLIDGFCSYVVSKGPARMQEAEDEGNEEDAQTVMMEDLRKTADSERRASMPLDTENLRRVDRAVEQWVSRGQYRNNGLKLPQVADELNVPRYLLTGWLRSQHLKYADWMNSLRVDEAKRVMREHPEWNNEAIAQHCGFCDRSYFLRKFKEATGMSPNEYTAIHTT